MQLLERENQLGILNDALSRAESGAGKTFVVTGEAGIGKSFLVEEFISLQREKINTYWGTCDALNTPRPLSPLYDICFQMKNNLIERLNQEKESHKIFNHFLLEIQKENKPVVIVIEDVHWADESTFDFIKFMGRRIHRTKILFIITCRDDESKAEDSLRIILADIPYKNIIRIKLNPLSENSVNHLEKIYGFRKDEIYNKTAGNPLFVTELIFNKDEVLPSTIKDVVLSKMSRLSAETKSFLELISVIPGKIENSFIKKLSVDIKKVIEESLSAGIIKVYRDYISFKHELVRLAIEDSMSFIKKEELNEQVLSRLLKQIDIHLNLADIVHHAVNANNINIVSEYAPLAAEQASALGAHSQAANHYLSALKYEDYLSPEKQIQLYEGRSYECYLTGQIEEAIKACEAIIEILKTYNHFQREGENYRMLSRLMWFAGEDIKGEEYLSKAIEILEKLPVSKNLAMAYSNMSQLYMLKEETVRAVTWGEKALQTAMVINDIEIEVHALNNIGTAKMFAGDSSGEMFLKESLQISLQNDYHDHVSRAYINLGAVNIYRRNFQEANKYYSKGIEYCSEKDLHTHELCMTGEISKTKLYSGEWDEAVERAATTLERDTVPLIDKIIPLSVIGLIRARRNDPGFLEILNEANALVSNSGELGKIVTVKSAIAEAYWLQNKLSDVIDEIESLFFKIKDMQNTWAAGEIAYWLWKGGRTFEISDKIAAPFLHQIKGNWKEAAMLWEELNCPYEQALALSEGNTEAKKKALIIFDKLGALASSQLIKQKMREKGIKNIPKGPRKSTKENPAGLTARQMEVINLLKENLSNSEIAERLYISAKTVDHHVSAILSKLNIHSRSEAAALFNSNKI